MYTVHLPSSVIWFRMVAL